MLDGLALLVLGTVVVLQKPVLLVVLCSSLVLLLLLEFLANRRVEVIVMPRGFLRLEAALEVPRMARSLLLVVRCVRDRMALAASVGRACLGEGIAAALGSESDEGRLRG